MPIFRRPAARPAIEIRNLAKLSDRELGRAYLAVDTAIDADDDPQTRADHLDEIAVEVLRRRPDSSTFWYNRGMYAKWARDWPASLEYNRKALDLLPADERAGEPAAWNLAIAATALADWKTAREAWTAFGIQLPETADPQAPIEADFGRAAVRLNAVPRFVGERPLTIDDRVGEPEVVAGQRLCPARVRVSDVPSEGSGHRLGDVVLHDIDPVGSRELDGEEVGVFNEIALLERSSRPTVSGRPR